MSMLCLCCVYVYAYVYAMSMSMSILCVCVTPVCVCVCAGNVLGVLQCINTLTDTAFTPSDVALLEMVAEQIGNALKGAKARTAQVCVGA
jgi:hypothetical protein